MITVDSAEKKIKTKKNENLSYTSKIQPVADLGTTKIISAVQQTHNAVQG